MNDIGRLVIFAGVAIVIIGILLSVSDKIPWIGKLPGDIYIKKEGFSFYFPLTTSILISLFLSFILRIFNK